MFQILCLWIIQRHHLQIGFLHWHQSQSRVTRLPAHRVGGEDSWGGRHLGSGIRRGLVCQASAPRRRMTAQVCAACVLGQKVRVTDHNEGGGSQFGRKGKRVPVVRGEREVRVMGFAMEPA